MTVRAINYFVCLLCMATLSLAYGLAPLSPHTHILNNNSSFFTESMKKYNVTQLFNINRGKQISKNHFFIRKYLDVLKSVGQISGSLGPF